MCERSSQRNFLTLTGTYKGVPVSVIAIGMGFSVVDFLVRECRAVVEGDMAIVRLGSCGAINRKLRVGDVVIPRQCCAINRRFDYFHPDNHPAPAEEAASDAPADPLSTVDVSKPFPADESLNSILEGALRDNVPKADENLFSGRTLDVFRDITNLSADDFYPTQGRTSDDFVDDNDGLLAALQQKHSLDTLEMETFMLIHLAHCHNVMSARKEAQKGLPAGSAPRIQASAMQMCFINRHEDVMITPQEVHTAEDWTSLSVLEAVAKVSIAEERLHPTVGSVWEDLRN